VRSFMLEINLRLYEHSLHVSLSSTVAPPASMPMCACACAHTPSSAPSSTYPPTQPPTRVRTRQVRRELEAQRNEVFLTGQPAPPVQERPDRLLSLAQSH
jgi:hypothetical protein